MLHKRPVSQKAQAARARLEARVKGSGYRSTGLGSLVVDVGSAATKIGVVGDLMPVAVVQTPPAVAAALRAAEVADSDAIAVSAFVTALLLTVPQAAANSSRCVVLLCDALSMTAARPGRVLLATQLRRAVASHTLLPLCSQALALGAFGLTSGIVVDIGYASTRVVPVIGTVAVDNAITISPLGVRLVLERMAAEAGVRVAVPEHVFDGVLRSFGAVAPRSAESPLREELLAASYLTSYKNVAFPCSPSKALEATFFDSSRDADADGGESLGALLVRSVARCCPLTQRPVVVQTPVVVIGGGSAIPNMAQRLREEAVAAAKNAAGLLWAPQFVECPLPVAPGLLGIVGGCVSLA
jgi:hypothetical protein